MVIKYLGSKRTLVPALGQIFTLAGAREAVDLFTGTTRVAQEMKRLGITPTTVDTATYSEVFAKCYIEADANQVDMKELTDALKHLNSLKGEAGYFTENFAEKARYIQPKNAERVDSIREALETDYKNSDLYYILLTSLVEAADKVDSTVGLQMAYLKKWAARSNNDMTLTVPPLLPGTGTALLEDATQSVKTLPHTDLMYFDPPYNQHRYYTNYHVWETLVRWDKPEGYGIANKRIDARDDETKSDFNKKNVMPLRMEEVIRSARADTLVVSYNNESWVNADTIKGWLEETGKEAVLQLDFDFKRHVGASIGIYNPQGEKTGTVSHKRNIEHIFIAGTQDVINKIKQAHPTGE